MKFSFSIALILLSIITNAQVYEFVGTTKKINLNRGNLNPTEESMGRFGEAVESIGDFDGDGVPDFAVGAPTSGGYMSTTFDGGSVHLVMMNSNGTAKSEILIHEGTPGFYPVSLADNFGQSITNLGDIDGDGVIDLAVGIDKSPLSSGSPKGSLLILLLNSDGTVKDHRELRFNDPVFSGQILDSYSIGVSSIGDLNGDGTTDLAISSRKTIYLNQIHLVFLNPDGTAISATQIDNIGGETFFWTSDLGSSMEYIGDINSDGKPEFALGVPSSFSGADTGKVFILSLNTDGTIYDYTKIGSKLNGFEEILPYNSKFGSGLSLLDDLDGDGIPELAVGDFSDHTIHILFLDENIKVRSYEKISETTGGLSIVGSPYFFGFADFGESIASSDINGDGLMDLVVGAPDDGDGGLFAGGSIYVLLANSFGCGEVEDLSGIASLPTSVGIDWYTTPGALNYRIQGGPVGGGLNTIVQSSNTRTLKLISGLSPGTDYNWRIRAECPTGNGPWSASQFFSTPILRTAKINSASVYPNPTKGELYIQSGQKGIFYFEIYTADGMLVQNKSLTNEHSAIDIHDLTSGMYFLKLDTGEMISFSVID